MILIGNKSDLEEQREVTYDEGMEFAEKNEIKFFETSAKTEQNIEEIFSESADEIAKKIDEGFYDLENQDCGIKKGIIDRKIDIEKLNSEMNNRPKKKCC